MKTWHKPAVFSCSWQFLVEFGGYGFANSVVNDGLDICLLGLLEKSVTSMLLHGLGVEPKGTHYVH